MGQKGLGFLNDDKEGEYVLGSGEYHAFEDQVLANKRIRLSNEFNQQKEDVNSSEQTSPLGLKLRKTPSFLNLLETQLFQARKMKFSTQIHEKAQAKMDDFLSQPMSEKLKASNFPASLLRIGSWERISRHEGDLITKCYYAKRKLVWEILEGALKSKIEIQWSDILAIRAIIGDSQQGILEIELNQPPLFFRETDPKPRKHTLWEQASDFTGGQAQIFRRHYVIFPPGALDKHYEKLLQCDQRLLMLSQRPFPTQASPYFNSTMHRCTEFPFDFNGCGPAVVPGGHPGVQYVFANFPTHFDPRHHVQNFIPMPGIMDSNSQANNYANMNQRIGCWGSQRGMNIVNNFPSGAQIQGSSSIALAAQANPSFLYQDHHVMNYGEPAGSYPLNDIENHLLGDSQALVGPQRVNPGNDSCTNNFEREQENFSNDHFILNATTENSGVNGGLNCPRPIYWLPSKDSGESIMMLPPRNNNNSLYPPYVFSKQTEEDFAAIDANLRIQ